MNRSAEKRIRRAAEMCRPKWCSVARPETLEIRGQMVVEDGVRRGKQNVVIGWVNALKTRLVTRESMTANSLHWWMDLGNWLSTGPQSLLYRSIHSNIVQIHHLMHSYFVFIHLRYNWNIIIFICLDRYKNKVNSESNRDWKMAKLLYGFWKNLSLELLRLVLSYLRKRLP